MNRQVLGEIRSVCDQEWGQRPKTSMGRIVGWFRPDPKTSDGAAYRRVKRWLRTLDHRTRGRVYRRIRAGKAADLMRQVAK
jgi:hypothetical protein